MQEPFTTHHPVDEIEPEISREDAIAELSERLAFAFAWMLNARDSKAVALRAYALAHHFCPQFLKHETLQETGQRLGVTRQAVCKLSSELRDLVVVRPPHAKSDGNRVQYQRSHL